MFIVMICYRYAIDMNMYYLLPSVSSTDIVDGS